MTTTTNGTIHGSHGLYSHRPLVWGKQGMSGGGTQLTAQAGLRALWQGGNAVDAAVASALAAGVLEPTAHYTLGGEVAMLLYDAEAGKVRSVVGQGWAPRAATIDLYMERWGEIPPGVHSSTVPGVVSALLTMLSAHGTTSFEQAAASAIQLADGGFPAYPLFSRTIATPARFANLSAHADSARVFLPGGSPPPVGSNFRQPDLARTLSLMAQAENDALAAGADREGGIQAARDCFYKGDPARRMVAALKELGGLYDYEDFAEYESPFEEPVSVNYRGYTVYTNRTWTQGMALLQTLSILEGVDLAALGHNSPEAIHVQVEALKLAMADRERYAGDPISWTFRLMGCCRRGMARCAFRCWTGIGHRPSTRRGDPRAMRAAVNGVGVAHVVEAAGEFDGTTYLSTADAQGNMVSATPSSFAGLAQGMVLGDTGIVINCRGCYFWLDPDNPNALAPRKRPRTTPCTFIVLKDGKPFMTLGTPGGDSQVQSNLQVFTNIADFGMDVQEAVSAPRFCGYSFPSSPWPHGVSPNRLSVESRIPRETAGALAEKGHDVNIIGPWGIVNGFTPIVADNGVYTGGADPRRDAVMLGW